MDLMDFGSVPDSTSNSTKSSSNEDKLDYKDINDKVKSLKSDENKEKLDKAYKELSTKTVDSSTNNDLSVAKSKEVKNVELTKFLKSYNFKEVLYGK